MNWNPMTESLPAQALREVTLVVAEPAELEAVNAALEREHYLGAVTPNNREVVQLALRHNQVLAIVVWTRAARKLAAREAWIGWDGRTRTRRLPLLVQNNRFLVLSKVRQTNLASRVLGLPWRRSRSTGSSARECSHSWRRPSSIRNVTPAPATRPRAGRRSAARPASRGTAMIIMWRMARRSDSGCDP